jgi:hypothetical protein
VTILGCTIDLSVEDGKKIRGWGKSMRAALQEEGRRLRHAGAAGMRKSPQEEADRAGRDRESSKELHGAPDIFDDLERMFGLNEAHWRYRAEEWDPEPDMTLLSDDDVDVAV